MKLSLKNQFSSVSSTLVFVPLFLTLGIVFFNNSTIWLASGLLISIMTIAWSNRKSKHGLNKLVGALEALQDGNFAHAPEIIGQGPYKKAHETITRLQTQFRATLEKVGSEISCLSKDSEEFYNSNTILVQYADQQACDLEQSASAIEQLTASVQKTAENAQHGRENAHESESLVTKGAQQMQESMEAMKAIDTSSLKISEIVGVIDEIAFQTNLLALNASVEAARAGEQGRGFAVVASEVRNLAQRSSSAAKEIKDLINESVKITKSGTDMVSAVAEDMQEIVESFAQSMKSMSDIAIATGEQTKGIQEVNTTVTRTAQIVRKNLTLVEDSATASASMTKRVQSVVESLNQFAGCSN